MELRKIVSLTLLSCGTTLICSSLVLFIAPQWNVAYWTGWRVLGMHKAQWSSLHMNLGLIMLITVPLHLILNREHIVKYVKNRAKQLLVPSRELAVALVLAVTVIVGTRYELPPLKWTTDLHRGFQYKVAAQWAWPSSNNHLQPGRLEAPEVRCIHARHRSPLTQRRSGDHAIDQGATPSS